MKIIGIIQARMNSKRLPGKVLLNIIQKPILWHIYNRMKHCKNIDQVVISTGDQQNNSEISDFAQKYNIPYFIGDEKDLIDRLYKTATFFHASAIVRVTADCPLIDSILIDTMINQYVAKKDDYDIVRNYGDEVRTFPHGLDTEIFSYASLEKMWHTITSPDLREWFPLYVKQNPSLFRILEIKNPKDISSLRLTVDYPEDFEFITKIYQKLYVEDKMFYLDDILNLLEKEPELRKINSKYVGYHNIDAPKI